MTTIEWLAEIQKQAKVTGEPLPKFIGDKLVGEAHGSFKVIGNFNKKHQAVALISATPGAFINPYLKGKYATGWIVLL